MASFSSFQKRHSVVTNGNAHKYESDIVIEATWDNCIEAQVAYFYDFFNDEEPLKIRNIHPEKYHNAVPISIKYIAHSSQTYEKDQVSYWLQFKPSFSYKDYNSLDYYDEKYGNIYDSIFPVGMYVAIKDNKGNYNKWMVVDLANFYDAQFSTYEILPCNNIFNYIFENKKYSIAGILRSQSSYTSGVWRD